MAPTQVFELFLATESSAPTSFQLVKCKDSILTILPKMLIVVNVLNCEVIRVVRASDWPIGHQSKVTINMFQLRDRDVRRKKVTKLVLMHENVPKAKVKSVAESWEKHFWRKMRGIITSELRQSYVSRHKLKYGMSYYHFECLSS